MPDSPENHPEYVTVPLVKHVPDVAPPEPQARTRAPLSRRILRVSAAGAVGALALCAALPLTSGAADAEQPASAAAAQRLFSEVSTEAMPASFAEVSAVDSEEAVSVDYRFDPEKAVNYPFAQPVLLTDVFGYRTAPVEQFHDAQDFAATEGTPIQAIADGVVLEAGYASDGCGFGLKLEHEIDGHTVTSRYCHMQTDSHAYAVGDEVAMGDPAGKVGATGLAFGAHLHLAVVMDDEPIDPMPFLAKYSRIDRDDLADGPAAEESDEEATPAPDEAIATSEANTAP